MGERMGASGTGSALDLRRENHDVSEVVGEDEVVCCVDDDVFCVEEEVWVFLVVDDELLSPLNRS